jgi:hypothetical protein
MSRAPSLPPAPARAIDWAIDAATTVPSCVTPLAAGWTGTWQREGVKRLAETAGLRMPRMHPHMPAIPLFTTMLDASGACATCRSPPIRWGRCIGDFSCEDGGLVTGQAVQRRFLVALIDAGERCRPRWVSRLSSSGVATECTCYPIPLLSPRLGPLGVPSRAGERRLTSTPTRIQSRRYARRPAQCRHGNRLAARDAARTPASANDGGGALTYAQWAYS